MIVQDIKFGDFVNKIEKMSFSEAKELCRKWDLNMIETHKGCYTIFPQGLSIKYSILKIKSSKRGFDIDFSLNLRKLLSDVKNDSLKEHTIDKIAVLRKEIERLEGQLKEKRHNLFILRNNL